MASTQLFIIMWSPVIGKIRSMNLRFGSEEFSRKNTSAVARPHKTRSTSRNCLKKVIITTMQHHEIVQVKRRADGTSKWFGFVTFTSRKAAEQVYQHQIGHYGRISNNDSGVRHAQSWDWWKSCGIKASHKSGRDSIDIAVTFHKTSL